MAISPGRPAFRPLTRVTTLAWLPDPGHPPNGQARPSRSRIAVPPYPPAGWAAAHSLVRRRPEGAMAVGSSTVALLIA